MPGQEDSHWVVVVHIDGWNISLLEFTLDVNCFVLAQTLSDPDILQLVLAKQKL